MKGLSTEADLLRRWCAELIGALAFLTRLPAGGLLADETPPLVQAMRAFPLAGALIGAVGGLILQLASMLAAPPLLAATIALASLALLTGALHEDGLADMVDGLSGGQDRDERLAIMRDSRIGAFGVMALVLVYLAKAACLGDFASKGWYLAPALMAGTGAFSRALMVWLMRTTRPARRDGLSATAGEPTWETTRTALLIGGAGGGLLLFLTSGIALAILSLAAGWAIAALVRDVALKRIGGQTGDILGGVQVLSETAMLAIAAAVLN